METTDGGEMISVGRNISQLSQTRDKRKIQMFHATESFRGRLGHRFVRSLV